MAFTDTTNLGKNLVQTAYDRYVEFALRTAVTYRAVIDKRPVQQSMPGSSVVFNLYPDMVPVTAPLTETVDPDAVAIPQTNTVSVTLEEWGNAVQVTRKLRLFSLSDVDPAIADLVAYNMVDSLDRQIMAIAAAGTNVIRENAGKMIINGGTTVAVQSTDTFKSRDARAVVAGMRNRAALPREGELYIGYINPDESTSVGYAHCWACLSTFVRSLIWPHGVPRTNTALPEISGTAPLERMKVRCGLKPHVPCSLRMVLEQVLRQLFTAH